MIKNSKSRNQRTTGDSPAVSAWSVPAFNRNHYYWGHRVYAHYYFTDGRISEVWS
jgi:hypothetical protein